MIETLEGLDADRKCFRLIGGVLVERTVKEVLPAMAKHLEQVRLFSMSDLESWHANTDSFCFS